MVTGFSLSPGGLLFPYHIGALASLTHHGYLKSMNPILGSSAGAIAAISHGSNVDPIKAVEATVRISDKCIQLGKARGNLLPLLVQELNELLPHNVEDTLNNRQGLVGVAYKEIFPVNRNVLQTRYIDKQHVIDCVCNSSMFPFFATPWPCRIVKKNKQNPELYSLPTVAVDGFFTVPRERFGCPDFDTLTGIDGDGDTTKVSRCVTVSVFPHEAVGLSVSDKHDRISPVFDQTENAMDQLSRLFKLATQAASRKEYFQLYENGWSDAETWINEEQRRQFWALDEERRKEVYSNAVSNLN